VVTPRKESAKDSLTAEIAENAEQRILRILSELGVLRGKTSAFFHTLRRSDKALSLFWNRIRKFGFVRKIRKITVSRAFKNVDPASETGV
jgi:hypothetical protein